MATFDLHDIQGYILRGYRMDYTRHFVLHITDADGARRFIGAIVEHDPALNAQAINRQSDSTPQITTAADWGATKPEYCLNIGFTYAGLAALQTPNLNTFPAEFREGAYTANRAKIVGDVGPSGPERWIDGFDPKNAPNVHIVLTLYALSLETLERTSAILRDLFRQQRALAELSCFDARALESYQCTPRDSGGFDPRAFPKVHFGYTDGIAQPTIQGAPPTFIPDGQPKAPQGEFLLGYPNQFNGTYPVPQPAVLGENGSFAAFRILEQDVVGFEQFLEKNATATLSKELLAAKICGRWRNGVPIVLSPETDSPEPPMTRGTIDNFNYATADPKGLSCPIGAHIRRTNPRDERVQGDGHTRRIVRRAMPYGPPYDPTQPDDGVARGLVGLFVNVSIADQFEFVMQNWVNQSSFAYGMNGPNNEPTQEVLLGNNESSDGQGIGIFRIPTATGPIFITGFSNFVTTRGGAYLFLPSISALHYLADPSSATAATPAEAAAPATVSA
jgi:Dyp-type peroxidase family